MRQVKVLACPKPVEGLVLTRSEPVELAKPKESAGCSAGDSSAGDAR